MSIYSSIIDLNFCRKVSPSELLWIVSIIVADFGVNYENDYVPIIFFSNENDGRVCPSSVTQWVRQKVQKVAGGVNPYNNK